MLVLPMPVPAHDADQSKRLEDTRNDVARLRDTIAELRKRVDHQAVLLRTMFGLLQEKHGFTAADLLDRFRTDLAEHAKPSPKMCKNCGRAVNLKFHRCMYCETPQPVESVFELV